MQKAMQIKKLSQELESSLEGGVPSEIKPICFLSLQMSDGNIKEVYLVENPVFMTGFSLISPSSPLGKAIMGKKAGDAFSYSSGEQNFEGKILEIQ